MKTKQVTRYTCDYCGKHSYSASHMSKHERHCTMNPHRACRVCKMLEHEQPNLEQLRALLPDGNEWANQYVDESGSLKYEWGNVARLQKFVHKVLPDLRKQAGNCPACIMAALRQQHIYLPIVTAFNFTNEMKDIWTEINEARKAADEWASCH